MGIRGFTRFVNDNLEKHVLENCPVVIDGLNFFYDSYKKSKRNILTGGEYDGYAIYLRELMETFQRNNVICYVVFKGGNTSNIKKRIADYQIAVQDAARITDNLGSPILSRNVVRQILDELGIKYAATGHESKNDIVDLAIALNCPIISLDTEFCFYRVEYVPSNTISFENGKIECKIYRLERFLQIQRISEAVLPVFSAILDEKYFKKDFFSEYLPSLRKPTSSQVIQTLLTQLRNNIERVRQTILVNLDDELKKKFLEAETFVRDCLSYTGNHSYLVNYFLTRELNFEKNDPLWFTKGICLGHIHAHYADIVKHRLLFGSRHLEDLNAEDSLQMSLEIIRYVYDLLTNYDGSTFTFMCKKFINVEVTKALSIAKPDTFTDNFFNSGWSDSTSLFDTFLEIVPFDSNFLKQLPESAHILMITLVYFGRRSKVDMPFAYSMLLCYLLLDICSPRKIKHKQRAIGDSTEINLYKIAPTAKDCRIAGAVMAKYFTASDQDLRNNLDRKTLHQIVQFQYCLLHINHLNVLCATKYPTTIYHKTFNGTFIYNMMKQLEVEALPLTFVENLLSGAPTVLPLFLDLVSFYENLV